MHVQMWHALAHAIIHRHECSVGFHGGFDGPRQKLHVFEVRPNLIGRQISQSFVVFFGDNQAMTGKNRTMVEKGDGVFVFKDNAGRQVALDNLAEETGGLGHFISTGL